MFAVARPLSRWRLVALIIGCLLLGACPGQDLAPLIPCTVAGVSIDAAGAGLNKVDLLFVVDDSGSMAEEQAKLTRELPRLVRVLTSGDLDGVPNANGQPDFPPVASLRLGVVSSDLGINGQKPVGSCADAGKEGKLLHATQVAATGIPQANVPPRPVCAGLNVPRFLEFGGQGMSAESVAEQFSCVATLGIQGCGLEQQLESMWRALASSDDRSFSRGAAGQGAPSGYNAGFLREDAVLTVIMVTDEEDCSSPDQSATVVYSDADLKVINVLCTRHADKLHAVSRYVQGLKSLKPKSYEDRIIFAGIVGVPTRQRTQGLSLDQILALPEMQVAEQVDEKGTHTPRPSCVASAGAGDAAPARRFIQVAKGFGDNGVITSICEDEYGSALSAVIDKIALKLKGQCLPRVLERDATTHLVECTVVEIKAGDDRKPCSQTPGRTRELPPRTVGGTPRIVCEVAQLPVTGRTIPSGHGWYYDDFSEDALQCVGNPSRVAFSESSPLSPGAAARFECFQVVARVQTMSRGQQATNTPCVDDGSDGPHGDAKCAALSLPNEPLVCVEGSCQRRCENDAQCLPGYVCAPHASGRRYCENPTCPVSPQG